MNFTITGKTFDAKDIIRKAGFEWDAEGKQWIGDADAADEFARITRPTYSARNARCASNCEVVEIAQTPATIAPSATPIAPVSAPKPFISSSTVRYGSACSVCGERITSRSVDTNYARGNYCGCEGA